MLPLWVSVRFKVKVKVQFRVYLLV